MTTVTKSAAPISTSVVERATGTPDRSTVFIADRYTVFREALVERLSAHQDFRVVGHAADRLSVMSACARSRPDMLLLDIELLGTPASQTTKQTFSELLATSPNTRVLVVTMLDNPGLVNEVLRLGVCGYLHKSASCAEIITALAAVRVNQERLVLSVPRTCILEKPRSDETESLSTRERQVLTLVAKAMTNRQIAAELHITEGTVKRHMRNIFGKLKAVSRIDAVNKAAADSLVVDVAGGRRSA